MLVSSIYLYDATGDFSETYLGLDVMGVGLFYSAGDKFGDYAEISYGFDAGPGSIALSYGDYEDSGTNYLIGYDIPVGAYVILHTLTMKRLYW